MIGVLLVLIVVGVALWIINQHIPMSPPFKTVVNVIAVVFLVLWLLNYFGVIHSGPHFKP